MAVVEKRRAAATGGVLAGFFIVMLDTTIVNVVLPDIGSDLGASVSGLQWIVDAYTLVLAALLLTAGAACDRLDTRTVYVFGLGWLGLMSICCALAPTTLLLVIARALQGVGAAAIIPGSLALLAQLFPEPGRRARAIGLWGGAGGVAAAVGPVIGGFLVSVIGWRVVFWVNIPVVVLACWAALHDIAARPGNARRGLDLPGLALSVPGLAVITWAVIAAGEHGWMLAPVFGLALGVLVLAGFVLVEHRVPAPMLPLSLFHSGRFSVASVVGFALNVSFFGQLFVLSLFFQRYLGYEPWLAGLALAPQACSAVVGSPLGGRASARFGPFPVMLIGLLVGAVGFGGLAFVSGATAYPIIAALSFAGGLGMAFAMPAATAAAVATAPAELAGTASGVINTARQTGTVIGVATLGTFATGSSGFLPGFQRAVTGASLVFLVAAVLVAVTLVRHRRSSGLLGASRTCPRDTEQSNS
ncbi:Spectinomycin tetracycline efflux pump [Acidipropionibacterium jensenii]|uniref:Spectinomycin tetracycline efflux pump n=1 Tax=Acidipropionibacterium jensenii TaxID=1749 RepID=A0A448P277_9ACTN|nr:DHA2 family efflux MFS transporter permease subunit [Acidipropionibacterium jensenii]VEI04301.1 Spectinomycin tetracycline efflux pump [Acidipropionibacterium jensenii]